MEVFNVCVAFLSCVAVQQVVSYPTGAPPSACVTMAPKHNGPNFATPQSTPSPYMVTANTNTYKAGSTITVMISGTQTFQGFLLQAREANSTTPIGTFSGPEPSASTKLATCTTADTSVTHSSADEKSSVNVTWTAPSATLGDIMFVATVLQNKATFWVGHKVSVMVDPVVTTEAPVVTTKVPSGGSQTNVYYTICLSLAIIGILLQ